MDEYLGKSGNEILQMAIDAKSFDEMREHLSALAAKQSLDKSRLAELVDTAIRIGRSASHVDEQRSAARDSLRKFLRASDKQQTKSTHYWPETLIEQADRTGRRLSSIPELREISPLRMVGYRVGYAEGLDENDRWDILTSFFESKLNPRLHEIFPDELGQPYSIKRLLKMAHIIASICKLNKRKRKSSLEYSIECWEKDLAFLKERFFDPMQKGKPPIGWPGT